MRHLGARLGYVGGQGASAEELPEGSDQAVKLCFAASDAIDDEPARCLRDNAEVPQGGCDPLALDRRSA